jgi:hypothetical protein
MALAEYKKALNADSAAVSGIEAGVATIDKVIEELRSESPEAPDTPDYYRDRLSPDESASARSIFDDVDQ